MHIYKKKIIHNINSDLKRHHENYRDVEQIVYNFNSCLVIYFFLNQGHNFIKTLFA